MQTGQRERARAGSGVPTSDPNYAVNLSLFTATLAQNAVLNGRVKLSEALAAGRTGRCMIQAISVTSLDQLDWEFWFWRNSQFQQQTASPAAEDFAGFWSFTVGGGDGKRIAGTGLYYYYIDGLGIPYWDDDAQTTLGQSGLAASNGQQGAYLNVSLVNRSAGAKTVNGWFDVSFWLEPTLGY